LTEFDLLIDLHLGNARQGPGSDEETRRAINLARLDPRERLAIADIGCGTGSAALVLARTLNAQVIAVDFAEPFLERLGTRAAAEGMSDHIEPVLAQMESLPFTDSQFDLIWSEGAIYNMGFAEGLRAWQRLLRPGGTVAVSEITWTTAHRPDPIEAYWKREYPGIATASTKLQLVEQAGYEPLGVFFLPRDCWENHYYKPLRSAIPKFMQRHGNSDAAQQIAEAEQAEMTLYREYGRWYSYAFYIARKTT